MMKLLIPVIIIASLIAFSFGNKPRPATLNHVAVYVKDLERSRDFYTEIVGIDTIPNPFNDMKHAWFKIGEHAQLHLIAGDISTKKVYDKNSHLCFSVSSLEDLIFALKKKNIPYTNWPGVVGAVTVRPDGVKQIYFQDPDGYWIEANNDTY